MNKLQSPEYILTTRRVLEYRLARTSEGVFLAKSSIVGGDQRLIVDISEEMFAEIKAPDRIKKPAYMRIPIDFLTREDVHNLTGEEFKALIYILIEIVKKKSKTIELSLKSARRLSKIKQNSIKSLRDKLFFVKFFDWCDASSDCNQPISEANLRPYYTKLHEREHDVKHDIFSDDHVNGANKDRDRSKRGVSNLEKFESGFDAGFVEFKKELIRLVGGDRYFQSKIHELWITWKDDLGGFEALVDAALMFANDTCKNEVDKLNAARNYILKRSVVK